MKGLKLEEFVYPERYMEQTTVTRRRIAIKEMGKRGLTLDQLEILTPFCRRYLRDIIANGEEPELALGLPEANVNTDNPNRTDGA
jgi:hypothetical protein